MAVLSKDIDYRVFDADNHYYEPVDMFARYIDAQYAERTFLTEERDGETIVLFEGRPFGFVGGSGNKRRVRPGALRAQLRGDAPATSPMSTTAYASEPKARLAMMDKQGIEATLMFPSTGVTIENLLRSDPELLLAHVRRSTDGSQSPGVSTSSIGSSPPRSSLWSTPTRPLASWSSLSTRGPGPCRCYPDRPYGGARPPTPIYDPFWARVQEAGTLVTYHLGNSGYMERYSADWGENPDPDGVSPGGAGARGASGSAAPTTRAGGRRSSGPCSTGTGRSWTPWPSSSTTTCSDGSPASRS